jgi:hypothetical protein
MTGFDGLDGNPAPTMFAAVTVKVMAMLTGSPVMVTVKVEPPTIAGWQGGEQLIV